MNTTKTTRTPTAPPLSSGPYFLSVPLNGYHNDFLLAFIAINGLISLLASCINLIIIGTIFSSSSLRTPSLILLLGLATSDFCVGLVAQPSYCVYLFSEYKRDASLFITVRNFYVPSNTMLATVSFITLTAITGDRFLAIHLHLRYQEFVTPKRCATLLALIWVSSLLTSIARFFIEKIQLRVNIDEILGFVIILPILLLNGYFIYNISKAIRRHSAQIHALQQPSGQQQSLNMPRYKKTVNTMHYVIAAFVASYIPLMLFIFAFLLVGKWSQGLRSMSIVAETLLMLNGLANPLIYCWRITEIRNAVRRNIRIQLSKLAACCWVSSANA